MKSYLIKYKSILIITGLILLLTAAFVPSNFKGKGPEQHDIVQYKGASSELQEYRKTEDKQILWTNALFAGMPTYVISNLPVSAFISNLIHPKVPQLWATIFKYVFFAFIMLLAFGVRPWLALVGAIGIGFATENFTIIDVGHRTKAAAIAHLPLVIAGCQWLFRKKWLLGLVVLSVGFGLEVAFNHVQITYYGGFIVLLFFVYQFVQHIKQSKLKEYAIASCLALLGAGIGIGANSLSLMMMNEYANDSIRGQAALTISPKGKEDNSNSKTGLTRDYVFSYSNGWSDIGATIIPNYSGGDSDKLGLYYGQIGSTSGPKYIGATIFILFVLGLVLVRGPLKWWLVTTVVLTIMLSMGNHHFTWLNNFMYDYFPLYNKFRAPSMMMVLVQISAGLLGVLGIERLLNNPKDVNYKHLTYAAGAGLAVILLMTFTGTMFNDFSSTPTYDETGKMVYDSDTRYAQSIIQRQGAKPTQQAIDNVKSQLVDRRIDEMQKDGKRSLFFILLVLAVLWFGYKQKIQSKWALLGLGLLVTADMWFIGKRYLNDKDFKKQRVTDQPFTPYSADLAIKQDKSYYRVLDLTESPLNSNRCAYFHKSIGGYSAAKMRRFQDLWEWYLTDQLSRGQVQNNQLLNMLNMKYFIYPNQQQNGGQPMYGQNPTALGNAWILDRVSVVENADSAILALANLQTAHQGIVEAVHQAFISTNNEVDTSATISLVSYHPEKMEYQYISATESNVAFSEVFYEKGWEAYIDDELVDHYRLNYILRGLKVPAGSHKVRFEFNPKTYAVGKTLSTSFGIVIYLLIALSLFLWIKSEFLTKKKTK